MEQHLALVRADQIIFFPSHRDKPLSNIPGWDVHPEQREETWANIDRLSSICISPFSSMAEIDQGIDCN